MNGELNVSDDSGKLLHSEVVKHPADYLKELLKKYKSPRIEGFPTFTGGLVGYFSYDYIKYSEPRLKLDAKDEEHFKDLDLMLFDKVIAFDNVKQKIVVVANACTDDFESNYQKACEEIDMIINLIINGAEATIEPGRLKSEYRKLFEKDDFCDMVNKAKNYIYEGEGA